MYNVKKINKFRSKRPTQFELEGTAPNPDQG